MVDKPSSLIIVVEEMRSFNLTHNYILFLVRLKDEVEVTLQLKEINTGRFI
jgi:hypothetical protein